MKNLILVICLFISVNTFAKTINCSVYSGNYCHDDPLYADGISAQLGLIIGVARFKAICEDGYIIDAEKLGGFVLAPGIQRFSLKLTCPLSGDDITGNYAGLKASPGAGVDFLIGALLNKERACFLRGVGVGVGMNFVAGGFKVTRDESRIEEYKYCSKKQKVVAKWVYKKCVEIDDMDVEGKLERGMIHKIPYSCSNSDKAKCPIENYCPVDIGLYPNHLSDTEIKDLRQKLREPFVTDFGFQEGGQIDAANEYCHEMVVGPALVNELSASKHIGKLKNIFTKLQN
ncbi:hypothetical protein OAT67_07595 [Bacteriovoracaceae bacterium]|nr:hypothetical protein [Bacteriovoracaceae bacterium]